MTTNNIGNVAILTKELRDMTGMPYGMCYAALNETKGDKAKALELLKEKGATRAEKLSDRSTNFGYVGIYRHHDGRTATLVELLCESDFVARELEFRTLADLFATQAAATSFSTNEEYLSEESIFYPAKTTLADIIKQLSAKTGENIRLGKISKIQI